MNLHTFFFPAVGFCFYLSMVIRLSYTKVLVSISGGRSCEGDVVAEDVCNDVRESKERRRW